MGTLERRNREREQRRQDIIQAAEKIFFDKGYDAATMDDVAEAAELSKGTLYLYFQSKQELLLGLAVWHLNQINAAYQGILDQKISGFEQLKKIGHVYFSFFQKRPQLLPLFSLIDTFTDDALLHSRSRQEWHAGQARSFAALQQAFINGAKDKSLAPGLDPLKATLLFGVYSQAVCKSAFFNEDFLKSVGVTGKEFLKYAFDFLERAVVNNP